jgi:hypothetical protein
MSQRQSMLEARRERRVFGGFVLTDTNLHAGPSVFSDAPANTLPTSVAEPAFASSGDALGFDPAVRGLAELAAHRSAGSPLTLGLLGPAGSGKSFALARLIELVGAFSKAGANGDSPYVPNVVVARVDAGSARDPATALAAGVFAAMQGAGGKMSALADDAATAGADPVDAARVASERLIDLRRRLDGERRTLSDQRRFFTSRAARESIRGRAPTAAASRRVCAPSGLPRASRSRPTRIWCATSLKTAAFWVASRLLRTPCGRSVGRRS